MAKIAIQGGVKNYLGNQKTVSGIPIKWQSGPDAPDTELAYITKAEKNLLLKKDLHGSLKNGPNTGPKGIMSLDSQGDKGTYGDTGQSYGDRQTSDKSAEVGDRGGGYQERGDSGYQATIDRIRAATIAANKDFDDKKAKKESYDFRKSKYAQGYKPTNIFEKANFFNSNFQKQQNIKLAQKRAFQKYQDIEQYVDLMDDYGLTAEELAAEVAANPGYGYDFSNLEKGLATLTSNKGTSIESTRPNLYDVNSALKGRFSLLNPLANKFRPDTQVTALNTLKKARDYNTLAMDPTISKEKLDALANRGKTPDQINPPDRSGGGGGQQYIPYLPPEEIEEEEKEFDYRFGTGQKIGRDVTLGYAANGGRITRAGGGIMNAVPRQGFFLGKIAKGIGKAIGSVADAAGKVLKSPLGKAAIIGLGGYYAGGGNLFGLQRAGASGFGSTGFGAFAKSLGQKALLKDGTGPFTLGNLSLGKLGLLGASALPFFMKQPEDPDIGMTERGGRLKDSQGNEVLPSGIRKEIDEAYESGDAGRIKEIESYYAFLPPRNQYLPYPNYAVGGRVAAQEGGLMNLGGMEKDYRAEGGFVPIGKQEKADDVPARLSVNEFVFTADAVRNAGGGDIDKGAEVMENMMKNLENGGRVSEESQGNTGAQEMFSVSERIGEVI